MEIVNFEKSGAPLKVEFVVKNGVLAAAYYIKLAEKNSNKPVAEFDGDNQNPQDDSYYLPLPVEENDERIIRLSVEFYALDFAQSKNFDMGIEVSQGDKLLGYIGKIGELTNTDQSLLLFLKLKIK